MARHNETGRMGEDFAAQKLLEQGYSILCRNYRTTRGEIDIVAQKGEILAFVEVRTRQAGTVPPAETISRSKRVKLICAAYSYLEAFACQLQPRLDVFCVTVTREGRVAGWQQLEGAIDGSDYHGGF